MAVIFIDCYFNTARRLRFLNAIAVVHAAEASASSILRLAVISDGTTATNSSSAFRDGYWCCIRLPSVSSGNGEVINLVALDCEDVVIDAHLLLGS